MIIKKNTYNVTSVKSNLKGSYVILTNGKMKVANIATICDVTEIDNSNELILQVTGNIKNDMDGVFVNIEGKFYKISFKVISNDISKDILKSYMLYSKDQINSSYNFFDYCRIENKLKQVKISTSGGTFLDWYSDGKKTNDKISSYDGIWIGENYIRILPVIPPSLEFSISELLFEMFNKSQPFTSVGEYKVFVPGTSITSGDSYYENYITVNGIVIPDAKYYKEVTNDKFVAIDKCDKEFILYSKKDKTSEGIA